MIVQLTSVALLAATPQHTAASSFDPMFSDPEDGKIVLLCDPSRLRLSIRAYDDAASVDRRYPLRRVITIASLNTMLPNSRGTPQYRVGLVRWEQCGPYSIRFEGDSYNSNVEGELGAFPPFASIRIVADNQTLYGGSGGVRMTECPRDMPRAGDCTNGYAVRVDIDHAKSAKSIMVTETSVIGDGYDAATPKITKMRSATLNVYF